MPTYTTSARIKQITTGDETGTWGASTNTNLGLIDNALSYVSHANGDTNETLTISDGSSADGRYLFIDVTGSLTADRTLTLAPNTSQKIWIFRNSTTGGNNVVISQGSGANVTVGPSQTAVVYGDGAGSGAAIGNVLDSPLLSGVVSIGDSGGDANVTQGIVINQGSAQDQIISFKKSDVSHGFTQGAETDTWLQIKRNYADYGGADVQAFGENHADIPVVYAINTYGGQADTTKSTAGLGLITLVAAQHDGANSFANVTADGNVFVVRARRGGANATVMIVDEDGDLWLDGGVTVGGALLVSGDGPHAVGGSAVDNVGLRYVASFESGGAGSNVQGFRVAGNLTAANGDTSFHSQMVVSGSITTQDNSETVGVVSTVRVHEPDVTVGGDTVTDASTLHIVDAPTEGATNSALLVSAGASRFGGAVVPLSSDGAALGGATLQWSDLFLASGAVVNFNAGDVTITHSSNLLAIAGGNVSFGSGSVADSGLLRFPNNATLQFRDSGDTLNFALGLSDGDIFWTSAGLSVGQLAKDANVTRGVTVSQGSADDSIVSLKSSDVAHGFTSGSVLTFETDTFLSIAKKSGPAGGAVIEAIMEDGVSADGALTLSAAGGDGQISTTKSTSGRGLIEILSQEHDAGSQVSGHTSDANILAVRAHDGATWSACWILDEDGDTWQNGSATILGSLDHDGSSVGFYGTTPVAQQTGVAVSAAAIHAALVNLGLITS